jgi:hypothetical protein
MRARTASFRRGRSRRPIAFPRSHVRARVMGPPRPIRRFREHSRDLARRREHDGRREARTNRTPGDQHELLRDVGSTRADRAFVQRIRPSRQHGPDPGTMAIVNDKGCCRSQRVSGNRHRDLRLYCRRLGQRERSAPGSGTTSRLLVPYGNGCKPNERFGVSHQAGATASIIISELGGNREERGNATPRAGPAPFLRNLGRKSCVLRHSPRLSSAHELPIMAHVRHDPHLG